MAKPTVGSWNRLKKVARYLKKHPDMRFEYKESDLEGRSCSRCTPIVIRRGVKEPVEAGVEGSRRLLEESSRAGAIDKLQWQRLVAKLSITRS